ncbi:complex I subunit 1/NuoH family protein [Sandaracinus amylolyticus]|uniref:complex I subunit 1/NuoH family protein n=1 Tax=Sandaracinus amylolyticus TaxID=927083 RepID=UPI001F2881C1|nr:complex I subunit 1 family protein [Sandaracinus amylolyticus]UJR79272.1 NADH-quinone oxidoreductase subunit H [Sandaracinus amylolyticus]
MDLGWLVLVSILKIAFVIGVLLLLFAPVLVLAERRQSAFFQDRLGPYMGGFPMPRALLDAIPYLVLGAYVVAALCGVMFAISLAMVATGNGQDVLFTEPVFGIEHTWGGLMLVFFPLAVIHLVAAKILPFLFFDGRLTIFGGLHALFDAIKAFTKEDIVPPRGDKFLHSIAPIIAMVPAFATAAVIPFGPTIYVDYLLEQLPADGAIGGTAIDIQVANLNIGILYIFAIAGTGIIGAAIAGYASDNKYALLGGLRAASQMVSYEVTLGLSLVPMFMLYDSLMLPDMIRWQGEHVWGVLVNPLAFVLFFTASIAEYKRVPFDAPEGESEIVAGYFLEYSSGKWLMYMMGEFIEVAVSSAIIAVVFLGGWEVPFLTRAGWEAFGYRFDLTGTGFDVVSNVANSHLFIIIVQVVAFLAKVMVLALISIQVRWTLPRFRYDQIMSLCWKLILPLSLVNILVTGIFVLLFQQMGW